MNANWKSVQLGDYSHIILGGTPKTSEPAYWGGDIFWASVTDFNTDKKLYNTEKTITEKGLNESNTKLLDVGDIIISARGTVGKTVVCGVPMAFNQSCYALRAKSEDLYQDFLYYLINYYVSQLKKKATGGVFDTIVTDTLKSLIIVLPPLPTQQKIASILSAYDDLIENNLKRIKILEEMAQMIYREWFVNFRFPGHEKVKVVNSELGIIPEGWEVKKLGEICNIVMGQSPKSEFYNDTGKGLPFHQGVTDFGGRFPSDRMYCTVQNRIAEAGDILFSVRAPVGRINIANKQIVIGRGLCAIRSKTGSQAFVYQQLKNEFSEEDIMGGGTIFKSITKDDVYGIKVVMPIEKVVRNFEEIIKPIFEQLENLYEKIGNLRSTRDFVLPKLISGEIDVENANILLIDDLIQLAD
jgi:type I restriction enzyme S subunit